MICETRRSQAIIRFARRDKTRYWMNNTHTTSPSLLLRMRDHRDQEAWQNFCRVYGSLVYGYCRKCKLDANDAADVAQEVLLRVSRGIRKFEYDRSKGRFRDWLSRIVHNEISRWFSQRKRMATDGVDNLHQSNAHAWQEHFHQHLLAEALKLAQVHFSAATWQAFQMVWIDDVPSTDVAGIMNRNLDFVYTSKSRVLKRLKLEIERLAEDTIC